MLVDLLIAERLALDGDEVGKVLGKLLALAGQVGVSSDSLDNIVLGLALYELAWNHTPG